MRCATTTVHYVLDQHPQICMSPVKETNFFKSDAEPRGGSGDGALDLEELGISPDDLRVYEDLFRDANGAIAIGETSPAYLYHSGSADRIRALIPDTRLIAILRHPVDRAYSHYVRKHWSGREPAASFTEALERAAENGDEKRRYRDGSL